MVSVVTMTAIGSELLGGIISRNLEELCFVKAMNYSFGLMLYFKETMK